MYEYYIIYIVLIIFTCVFIYKREIEKTMAHMFGRLATKFIENMLEQVRQKLISDGYENWKFDIYQKEFTVAELLSCSVTVRDLVFIGASKFVTNDVSYDVTTSTANFDISIPKLYVGVGDSSVAAMIQAIGLDYTGHVKGWVTLMEPRVTGAVVLDMNDEGKITATSIDINIELKDIQSKIDLNAMETDYSETINNFLRAKLPYLINTYVNSCKPTIEMGLMSIANPILAQMF